MRIGFPATHLAGEQKRLMWANAIRVEITPDGNFGEKLWVFSEVIGGPPTLRDGHPTDKSIETCKAGAQPNRNSNLLDKKPLSFEWDCGKVDSVSAKNKAPLHLSAFTNIDKIRGKLDKYGKAMKLKERSLNLEKIRPASKSNPKGVPDDAPVAPSSK